MTQTQNNPVYQAARVIGGIGIGTALIAVNTPHIPKESAIRVQQPAPVQEALAYRDSARGLEQKIQLHIVSDIQDKAAHAQRYATLLQDSTVAAGVAEYDKVSGTVGRLSVYSGLSFIGVLAVTYGVMGIARRREDEL